MLHYNQSIHAHTDLADIAEAFLKGKEMPQLYEKPKDQKVFMKVPVDILDLHVPAVEPLDEAIRLNKELYGQKGAPRGWECSWWDANRTTGLRQSFLDPSLWIYHHNQQEKLAVEGKYERKYFVYKLSQILSVPASDLHKRVMILELHSEPAAPVWKAPKSSRGMLNPLSIELHDQLLPHCQRTDFPAGMLGTHVDDTLSGGMLLFYLRLICLYEHFGLGSFTRLTCGYRDNFVGRELAIVPYAVDQWRVKQYRADEEDMVALSGLELDESAIEVFSEEELAAVETRTGVKRDTDPTQYPEAVARTFDPWMFLDDRVEEPQVIYVSQQSYASKLTTISDEEIDTYFRRRVGASKWAKKSGDIKSPIRGKLGELIWLEKTNAAIVERLGDLASDAHYAEMATSASEIDLFLDELNNLVLLAQLPNMNVIRIYKIAELGEHFLGGGADAAKTKVGGSSFLAGEDCRRLGTISRFGGGKPGRVFHSSTGIETLAQKLLVSENVYLAQVTLDMFLCRINRPLLSITDARNLLTEPKEKNLRPDYHSIAMLVRERLLVIAHGPGDRFWADGLTKEARRGHLFLLHLCINFGLVDQVFYQITQTHIKRVLGVEEENRLARALDEEVQRLAAGKDEDAVALRGPEPSSHGDDASADGMILATGQLKQDYWTEGAGALTRWHVEPRVAKITPTRVGAVTVPLAEQWLTDDRVTKYTFLDGEKESGVERDSWRIKKSAHAVLRPPNRRWVGSTTFFKRPGGEQVRLTEKATTRQGQPLSAVAGDRYNSSMLDVPVVPVAAGKSNCSIDGEAVLDGARDEPDRPRGGSVGQHHAQVPIEEEDEGKVYACIPVPDPQEENIRVKNTTASLESGPGSASTSGAERHQGAGESFSTIPLVSTSTSTWTPRTRGVSGMPSLSFGPSDLQQRRDDQDRARGRVPFASSSMRGRSRSGIRRKGQPERRIQGISRSGWTETDGKWVFHHLPVRVAALFIPPEVPDRFIGGPGWDRLGVRRDTFYRWADQPSTAPLLRFSDQWRATEKGGLNAGAAPPGGAERAFILVRTELMKHWAAVDSDSDI